MLIMMFGVFNHWLTDWLTDWLVGATDAYTSIWLNEPNHFRRQHTAMDGQHVRKVRTYIYVHTYLNIILCYIIDHNLLRYIMQTWIPYNVDCSRTTRTNSTIRYVLTLTLSYTFPSTIIFNFVLLGEQYLI